MDEKNMINDVRLEKIIIENFKNVAHGELAFSKNSKRGLAELLGVYGQNGSGKTSLIDALSLLKNVLTGKPVPSVFANYINLDSEFARLSYSFNIFVKGTSDIYHCIYSFCIKKAVDDLNHNYYNEDESQIIDYKVVVYNEKLSLSYSSDGKIIDRMHTIIDTDSDKRVFQPASQYEKLIGKDIGRAADLLAARKFNLMTSRSFIFSRGFLNEIRQHSKDIKSMSVIESIVYYGNFSLFIFDMNSVAMLSCNILPIAFDYHKGGTSASGSVSIPVNGDGLIPETTFDIVSKVIDNMNIVLKQIVPGLTISIQKKGTETLKNGTRAYRVQLFSNKNSKAIPLCYESEGIKKIISVLELLINVYNRYSITVAIDELDSGVFEYLLGEILHIISQKGKGQLIFTSHNLRPLETLDKSFIAFTTTNPSNRYIRPVNIKSTNNLRDFYYRDITLGEQSENVYDSTNNYEIAMAFREAGE